MSSDLDAHSKPEGVSRFERMRVTSGQARAFTLLEVMLAVLILGLIATSIFRFVDSTLQVIQAVGHSGGANDELEALSRVVQYQLNDLPLSAQSAVLGQPHIFNGIEQDELQWRCSGGLGVFTEFAAGEYQVTLMVQADKSGGAKAKSSLGVRRVLVNGNQAEYNWVPLVSGVTAMKVAYYEVASNQWLEKWTDPGHRPNLIRLSIWSEGGADPYEVVLVGNARGGRRQQ